MYQPREMHPRCVRSSRCVFSSYKQLPDGSGILDDLINMNRNTVLKKYRVKFTPLTEKNVSVSLNVQWMYLMPT